MNNSQIQAFLPWYRWYNVSCRNANLIFIILARLENLTLYPHRLRRFGNRERFSNLARMMNIRLRQSSYFKVWRLINIPYLPLRQVREYFCILSLVGTEQFPTNQIERNYVRCRECIYAYQYTNNFEFNEYKNRPRFFLFSFHLLLFSHIFFS